MDIDIIPIKLKNPNSLLITLIPKQNIGILINNVLNFLKELMILDLVFL